MSRSAIDNSDLEAALVGVRRPLQPPPMPPANLRLRITTSRWLRSVLPTRLAVMLARSRGLRLWKGDPLARERALAGDAGDRGAGRRGRAKRLSSRASTCSSRRSTGCLFWQPWQRARIDAASAANAAPGARLRTGGAAELDCTSVRSSSTSLRSPSLERRIHRLGAVVLPGPHARLLGAPPGALVEAPAASATSGSSARSARSRCCASCCEKASSWSSTSTCRAAAAPASWASP